MTTVGVMLYPGHEDLDWCGPWEAWTMARTDDDVIVTVAATSDPVESWQELRTVPHVTFAECPDLDVLVVPGGFGSRDLMDDEATLGFIRRQAGHAHWMTSVCTGALLFAAAGLLDGKRATTHWAALDELRRFESVTTVDDERYVVDGNVVTAAGVSAGIDMALWVIGQEWGIERAKNSQLGMQYDPEPPYQDVDA